LGDQLDETNDDFNDDTFGDVTIASSKPVGKDFDFFGSTAKVSDAINEEQLRYTRTQAPPKSVSSFATSPTRQLSKPARSGYEKYRNLDHVSDLQIDPTLWGAAPTGPLQSYAQQPPAAAPAKRMLSLEEVEEQMAAQAKGAAASKQVPAAAGALTGYPQGQPPQQPYYSGPPRQPRYEMPQPTMTQAELPATQSRPTQILQRPPPGATEKRPPPKAGPPYPQNGDRPGQPPHPPGQPRHQHAVSGTGMPIPPSQQQIITHPQQLMHLSEEERRAFLIEDAKRAKRNHKIFLLSKDNGLMTPQDKNFITRIQLQQLMTATGNTDDKDPDAALSEDFYYQVHSQIRGGPRQNPHQPLSHFAQTYLFQTGGRAGNNRRHRPGGDNHMQRMEQQVHRAVEAAKLRPKNQQLVVEGSLGKISFSNAKAPRPMLNVKRQDKESGAKAGTNIGARPISAGDRKSVLKDLENVYSTLMKMEDEVRKEPPLPPGEPEPAAIEAHIGWRDDMRALNDRLWAELKVLQPIDADSATPHPFITLLSYPKGKKVIPRVFRHLSSEQRVTVLTVIVLNLDVLDVIRMGQVQPGENQLPTAAREAVELFSAAVTPSLFAYVSEAPLFNVIGLLGLILDRVNVANIAKTRVGLTILTMLTSRATLVKEAGEVREDDWQQWTQLYNRLFDTLEPVLGSVFPGSVNSGEDMYVWQFLAAIGSGANPEQQQRLVIAVKYVHLSFPASTC
jgi:DNA topoisomerase 2-associated protein PAT1